jgi:deazaflavin-dependent oxidoreductase (nitroreductase family)
VDYLELADRNWPILRRMAGGHVAIYRATRGVVGHRLPGTPQMLLLDHVGARSGTRRTAPLVYFRDGDDVVVVASKGGFPRNPAWFYNLRANPDAEIQIGSERRAVRARVATDEEHERLWPRAVDTYSGYATYQARCDRKIPLMILEPGS